jgi:hypothetical protein
MWDSAGRRAEWWGSTALVATLAAALASVGVIGADLPWLVPVGAVVAAGRLPDSIAAGASTMGWHDALAGGQIVVYGVYHSLGAWGLMLLQTLAAALGFGALAAGLRRQAPCGSALLVGVLVLVGSAPIVLVARVSLFSLALFPLLVLILENDARRPGRGVWLAVPLIALWANLHGLVLAGVAVLAAYLLLGRARREPILAVAVLGASVLAVCLTPQLWRTPLYYRGVFDNVAAARGVGLWAPLGLHPFDVLFVVVAISLVGLSRARLQLWEWVACLGLAAESLRTARVGFFLLVVLAYPAARAARVRTPPPALLASAACVFAVVTAAMLVLSRPAAGTELARRAAGTGDVVLADPIQGEWVELYGGRVWVGNPIDAFRRSDQALYLDWVAGDASGRPAVEHARLVLVAAASPAGRVAARDVRLRRLAEAHGTVLYEVARRG